MTIFKQAQQATHSGLLIKAEELYRQIPESDESYSDSQKALAKLLSESGRHAEALNIYKMQIDQNAFISNEEKFQCLLGAANSAIPLTRHTLAAEYLEQALKIKPTHEEAMTRLAGVLISLQQEKKALEYIKRIIRENPKNAAAYNLKGLAQCRAGDMEKGYKSFQMALKISPLLLGAIQNLMTYAPKKKNNPLIEDLIPQLVGNFEHPSTPAPTKMAIAYILATYYERKNKSALSFHYLKSANDLNRLSYQYKHQETEQMFDRLKTSCSLNRYRSLEGKGAADACPIFILGMPRSGTTLVEQILSSHSKVTAAGEVNYFSEACDESGLNLPSLTESDLDESRLISIGKQYIAKLKRNHKGEFITDKMPYNFILSGLIALALPNAKIIHCTRDPLETCFSIYKQNFAGNHGYTNNLEELGRYYNAYLDLMAYWKTLLGSRLYEANYEKMVNDTESEIQSLLDYCGLDTETACFNFQKNKRTVRTASVNQVRKGIYTSALKASSPYSKQLEPLTRILNRPDN